MKQEFRLEQRLILTPQLLLNLKLLALPILDLEMVIEQELATNPCLEIEEEKPIEESQEGLKEENEDEFSLSDLIPEENYSIPLSRNTEDIDIIDVANPAPVTSIDELLTKLRQKIDKEDYPIAEFICNSLDENGFLEFSIEEIAQTLGVEEERIKKIVEIIKKIEPGGIGSRTLKETLLAQLELKGFNRDSIEVRMLEECEEELIKTKNYKRIAAKLKTNEARVKEAFNNLTNLEPRPLRKYGSLKADYVVPDFRIKIEGEKISFEFNEENLPKLRIANYYKEILLSPNNYQKEQVDFIKKRLKNAIMFIKALEQRRETLKRIMEYIIENQKDFFLVSREIIRPLSIKECGEKLGIHPSNISRAIAGKYLETPFGIFPLRSFFSSGIGETSKSTIKAKIKNLIDNEDKNNPLTDDEIVEKLKEIGINIKRRTAAKYRQELNIPKASERKKSR